MPDLPPLTDAACLRLYHAMLQAAEEDAARYRAAWQSARRRAHAKDRVTAAIEEVVAAYCVPKAWPGNDYEDGVADTQRVLEQELRAALAQAVTREATDA